MAFKRRGDACVARHRRDMIWRGVGVCAAEGPHPLRVEKPVTSTVIYGGFLRIWCYFRWFHSFFGQFSENLFTGAFCRADSMASGWWPARGAAKVGGAGHRRIRATHGNKVVGGAGRRRIGRHKVGGAGRRRIGRGASPLLVHVLLDELDVIDLEGYDASRSIKTVVETIHIT